MPKEKKKGKGGGLANRLATELNKMRLHMLSEAQLDSAFHSQDKKLKKNLKKKKSFQKNLKDSIGASKVDSLNNELEIDFHKSDAIIREKETRGIGKRREKKKEPNKPKKKARNT